MDMNQIKTIVVVMMENRSFDHLLGYLSLGASGRKNVEGLKSDAAWLNSLANPYQDRKFAPFLLKNPYDPIDADPPHERGPIATQMGTPVNGVFPMDGFVTNYASAPGAKCLTADNPPPVMGYFTANEAPVTDFFAQQFAICDHWFSSLPAGTQPNRLMAMSGFSLIDVNQVPLPEQELVYDWLTRNGVRWRVYHEGMPFFAMMPKWIGDILAEDKFRPLDQLSLDIENEPPGEFPQAIFIEPTYTDCPHIGGSSDDHAPSAIKGGEEFLLEVYRDITQDPDIWAGTVMIVTYDEHGGFFDHVSPPAFRTDPPPQARYQQGFDTLGVRVPAFIISPFIEPGAVFNQRLDHTSILKFIGQKFGQGGSYSDLVGRRAVGSVLDLLNAPGSQRVAPTIPSLDDYLQKEAPVAGFVPGSNPGTPLQKSFQSALDLIREHPSRPTDKFKDLLDAFPQRARTT